MQEVFNFLVAHWEAITSVITLVLSVVIFIIRKKPVNSILYDFTEACKIATVAAEQTVLKDKDKLNLALDIAMKYIKSYYPDLDAFKYRRTLISIIESLLDTPHRSKEVK